MTPRQDTEPDLDIETEYRAIQTALLESARGRWFLAEHSRRSRRLDSVELEAALDKLKDSLREPPAVLARLQSELTGINMLIAEAKKGLLDNSNRPTSTGGVTADPGGPPTQALLRSAEDLHELIWNLQAKPADADACEKIGRKAAGILALSARQAQDSELMRKHAQALDKIADRVTAVLDALAYEAAADPVVKPAILIPDR